ncbi:MAG: alanine--tRNA ligase, partial [Acidobacteria bacterium]|nr:alanine--tRNA ligase [Acidobacteriota bacterium]
MNASQLRRSFTEFFVERGHTSVPSSSLIPHDDTLLFTNAGMVPFKPYFQGLETPPWPRVTTVQKCVRAGGKHNDLDEVGRTSRHLTFFEMLGNFSFGDYFKAEAIPYAWTFFTEVLGLEADRLWVTVHDTDDESAALWQELVGIAPERIQRLDEDNWWRMADTGPNGPCSEIFFDKGVEHGIDGGPAHGGEERFVEIWNLVFMQYDQQRDGSQVPLPAPSIDTGAGLERVVSVLQGVSSVWEIDDFQRLLSHASEVTKVADGLGDASDVSLRILADHARSSSFLIDDAVFPSNEDRGYALRRIIRRAIRHAYLLGVQTHVMAPLVDGVIEVMGADYPSLIENKDFICEVLDREEGRFRQTLASGSAILETAIDDLAAGETLSGSVAFALHDTYGFPLEVTEEIAREQNVDLDVDAFEAEMKLQRERARQDHAAKQSTGADDIAVFQQLQATSGDTEFVGRDEAEIEATVLAVTVDSIVLDRTPFYAESGGQIGDTGIIGDDGESVDILDTQAVAGGIVRHVVADPGEIAVGQVVTASIDAPRRAAIARHHTATHLLHWALRQVLGDHVKQQGSWVGPDRLRFDFSHYEALTNEQVSEIEDLVNAELLTNAEVNNFETTIEDATQRGAIA